MERRLLPTRRQIPQITAEQPEPLTPGQLMGNSHQVAILVSNTPMSVATMMRSSGDIVGLVLWSANTTATRQNVRTSSSLDGRLCESTTIGPIVMYFRRRRGYKLESGEVQEGSLMERSLLRDCCGRMQRVSTRNGEPVKCTNYYAGQCQNMLRMQLRTRAVSRPPWHPRHHMRAMRQSLAGSGRVRSDEARCGCASKSAAVHGARTGCTTHLHDACK